MKRREIREIMMQTLYQMEILEDYSKEVFDKAITEYKLSEGNKEYLNEIYNIITEKKVEIDNKIEVNLKDWTMDRISKVDISILRLALSEMMEIEDIPNTVSINEAVELAKKFSDDNSPKFINGVLGNIQND